MIRHDMKAATPRQQKIAAIYDADIWPLLPQRTAESILRRIPRIAGAQVLEVGAATGKLTLSLAATLDEASRVLAIDDSPAMLEQADMAKRQHADGAKVSFQVADVSPPWPVNDGAYDLAVSNLALADASDCKAAVVALARSLKPGGHLVITLPLRGSWAEFLDLYADVLTEQGKREGLATLRAYQAAQPNA
ncbi:MAG: class I SAM-dependent methyltransferase, partial [Deltaproteobacteria bacterium]|nr:class I SAM-dependent methyltransferase [Deltaproteobacteria bacterium]